LDSATADAIATLVEFEAAPGKAVEQLAALTGKEGGFKSLGAAAAILGLSFEQLVEFQRQAQIQGEKTNAEFLKDAAAGAEAAEGTKAYRKQVEALKQRLADLNGALPMTADLIREFRDENLDAETIAKLLGLSVTELEKALEMYGDTLTENQKDQIKWGIATAEAREEAEKFRREANSMERALEDLRDTVPKLERKLDGLAKSGATVAETMEILGGDLVKAGEFAKKFGIELDPAIKKLIEMAEAAEATSEFAKNWQDAWNTAVV